MESILTSVKKMLGIGEEYEQFDADLIIFINSVLSVLTQIGVGPDEGFVISSSDETWEDFIGTDKRLEIVKTYVYIKTRLLFDPPASSIVIEAMNNTCKEYEWRIRSEKPY